MRTVAATRADVLPSKTCTRCKLPKPLIEYYRRPRNPDGLHNQCKLCLDAVNLRWRDKNPERTREADCQRSQRLKQECIDAYGGRCACCGEDRLIFLSVDHVNGDGAEDRRQHDGGSGGKTTYRRLKKAGYPQDGRYQVLCFNCNTAKWTKTACPCRLYRAPEISGQLSLF